jgi:hypothetical protein
MALTYQEYSDKSSSEKIVVAHIEPSTKMINFTLDSGAIYKKTVDHYVLSAEQSGVALTEVSSSSLSSGEWYFDDSSKQLWVRLTADENPDDEFLVITFRLFFSNAPIKLPYDLNTGREVDYEPRIISTSKFSSQIESDQIGIALDGTGSIKLQNNDNYFRNIFEKLFWENKAVSIYSLSRDIEASSRRILYDGIIDEKAFSPDRVTFKLKDFITQLRDAIPMPKFTALDGDIPESLIGAPKRRLYGTITGLLVQPLDMILDGYDVSGDFTLTATIGDGRSRLTNNSASTMTAELTKGDELSFIDQFGEEHTFTIDSVEDGDDVLISDEPDIAIVDQVMKVKPQRAPRTRNRTHLIAGHPIAQKEATVVTAEQLNRITVDSTTDLQEGNFLTFIVAGQEIDRIVKRIVGNQIVLTQNLGGKPAVGSTVRKSGIEEVFIESTALLRNRDFVVDNTGGESKLIVDPLAEFNVAPEQSIGGNITFTNGSSTVTGSGSSFKAELRARDWIRPSNQLNAWHEILEIGEDGNLKLVIPFTGTNTTSLAITKQPLFIADDTRVSLNCFGRTKDNLSTGKLIDNCAAIVRDLLTEAGLGSKLDSTSFDNAEGEAPYMPSLVLPLEPQQDAPTLKDAVNLINRTIFGSLTKNIDFQIRYKVLHADKGLDNVKELRDHDFLKFKLRSVSKNIVLDTNVNYQHKDADRFTGERVASTLSIQSDISNYLVKTKREISRDVYLFKEADADLVLRRWAFFSEIAQSLITLQGKINLANLSINDPVIIDLDRMFDRLGTASDKIRIGLVSAVKNNGIDSEIEIDDLSGFLLTVCNMTETTADDYADASSRQRLLNGFMTNTKGIVNGLEYTDRINLMQ